MKEQKKFKIVTAPRFAEEAEKKFTVTSDGRNRFFTGECPRCKHPMRFPWNLDAHLGVALDKASTNVPFVCTCQAEVHPGTPEGRYGCGAYWDLKLDE